VSPAALAVSRQPDLLQGRRDHVEHVQQQLVRLPGSSRLHQRFALADVIGTLRGNSSAARSNS
jgi:hypothetical protein